MKIDDEINLCNRALFSRDKNLYKIVHRTRFIIVIEIVDQQIYDEYIKQKILIKFNKLSLRVKIYLIQNFQLNLIINMNILKQNNINFQLSKNILIINKVDMLLNYLSSQNNYIFFISLLQMILKNLKNENTMFAFYFASKSI